jgi:hypothetical protein
MAGMTMVTEQTGQEKRAEDREPAKRKEPESDSGSSF